MIFFDCFIAPALRAHVVPTAKTPLRMLHAHGRRCRTAMSSLCCSSRVKPNKGKSHLDLHLNHSTVEFAMHSITSASNALLTAHIGKR